ncbi:MAG: hypothetical protein KKC68_04560 [Candidatus Thermoplasmatota archaeon]|nr:hypothetical protein [Candidatus Thermoplasmatota archaeon]MBU1941023.1 hypothetical protein [Candidatus Thermoplasmatota archaeon]
MNTMTILQLQYQHAKIPKNQLVTLSNQLIPKIKTLNTALTKGYNDPHASLNLMTDKNLIYQIQKLKKEKQPLNPQYILIIGIGGSNLGTQAIQEALLGRHYNLKKSRPKILYADTVDPDALTDIQTIIEPIFQNGGNILYVLVSKSGGTTETIANFEQLLAILKKYKKDYEKYIVAITDKDSRLWQYAQKQGFSLLEIPVQVGGRFSVFSPVGLFPCAMLNIDIEHLLSGAQIMRNACLETTIEKNPAALSALLMYAHRLQGIQIHDLFLFCSDFESLGKWYRQLLGESIGKEYDVNKTQIFEGITPTISIGSTDLHSMAQIYLAGPYDKFTTFIRIKIFNTNPTIPHNTSPDSLIPSIQGKPLSTIMDAILTGTQTAYKKRNRPYMEITFPDKSAYSIGQFLQMKMIEIIYLGYLLNINPFDQPNVEEYKIETKKILDRSYDQKHL